VEWFDDVLGLPFEAGAEQPHPRSGLAVFTTFPDTLSGRCLDSLRLRGDGVWHHGLDDGSENSATSRCGLRRPLLEGIAKAEAAGVYRGAWRQ
jgi:hypothetical protein